MKKWTSLWAILLPCTMFALDASVEFSVYRAGDKPYVEFYVHVTGKSVSQARLNDSLQQGSVEVLLTFSQHGEIVRYDKYLLHGPVGDFALDFIDQRRYGLVAGSYDAAVVLTDGADAKNVKTFEEKLVVSADVSRPLVSDIQLLRSFRASDEESFFTKNGYFLEGLPYAFCDKNMAFLPFYFELYGLNPASSPEVNVTYAIEKGDAVGSGQTVITAHRKRKTMPTIPMLLQLDISTLESGNYHLLVEVRSSTSELLCEKRVFFQRSNPYLHVTIDSIDVEALRDEFVSRLDSMELRYSMKAIVTRISQMEVPILNSLLEQGTMDEQRRFLFAYWAGFSANAPEVMFQKYMAVARAVDVMYRNGFGYGFESDRGQIYLKYGRPADIQSVEDEPTAPPYEIWTYNEIERTNQKNVKFIFYNPSLVANGHTLLHSNCRGELSNPRWKVELYRDDPNAMKGNNAIDGIDIDDGVNRNGAKLFNDQ